MFLTASEVLSIGLKCVGFGETVIARVKKEGLIKRFRAHYGSSPLDVAEIWYDICHHATLKPQDKTMRGFKKYLHAHYWLWTRPKNRFISMSHFKLSEKEVSGQVLWYWIGLIARLKTRKIIWHEGLDKPNGPRIIISVDGTDFKIWEPSKGQFNRDPSWCSSKMKASAVRYELALDIWSSKLVWINGPFKSGSFNDIRIFKGKLMQKIKDGKRGIADRGYAGVELKICIPSSRDPPHVRNFSSRVRCRHETFNGRIKNFSSMEQTWTHGVDKHKIAVEAVCVIIQYQMDNGAPLFDP